MKTYSSNLGYLMNVFNISGKQISQYLNIDNSLVSKWKNGQRPLTINTAHLHNLVNFFLEYKNGILLKKVQELLSDLYPNENFNSVPVLTNYLTDFLISPFTPKTYNNKNDYIEYKENNYTYFNFQGNEGRRESVLFFLDQILNEKEPQEILLISQEDMSWLTEDPEFLKIWKNKLQKILWSSHKINIIHWVDRSTQNLGTIVLQWLPLYLSGNITSYYFPKYSDLNYNSTIFIIKNKLVLMGMEGATQKDRYSSLFFDYPTLNHSTWIFNNLLEKCKPLVKIFNSKNKTDFKKMTSEIKEPPGETLYLANFPGFYTMPLPLFIEILEANNLDKETYEKCLILYKKMQVFISTKKRKEIFSKDSVKKIFSSDSYIYKDISMLCDSPIKATKDQVFAHFDFLLNKVLENENYQIALLDEKINIDMFISVDEYVFSWNPKVSTFISILTEPNIIEAFHYDCLNLWQNIPTVDKDAFLLKTRMENLVK
ncbi:MAG: hypothetical protein PHH19_03420 [Eubacteriales bacterium]|nr:hypothetical protein [Eubacteriales bacterium]